MSFDASPLQTEPTVIPLIDSISLESLNHPPNTGVGFTNSGLTEDAIVSYLQVEEKLLDFNSGIFTVSEGGQITADYLVDGGKYRGELAIFSLEDIDPLTGIDFIKEAAQRALSASSLGHILISDRDIGARYDITPGEDENWNHGIYQGPQTFEFEAGTKLGLMFVPDGTVQQVYDDPTVEGSKRPLFSMTWANPEQAEQFSQIVYGSIESHVFAVEDQRIDQGADRDYNDFIFRLEGATTDSTSLDEVIDSENDWRETAAGQELINYGTVPIEPETGAEYRPHELLVKVEAGSEKAVGTLLQNVGALEIEPLIPPNTNLGSELHQWRFVTFVDSSDVLALREQLLELKNSGIKAIDLNYIFSATASPIDTDFEQQWGLNNTGQTGGIPGADIDAVEAWNISEGSQDIVVAVLDTGIDYEHSDLANNIWSNPDEIPGNSIDDDNNGYDDDVYGWDFTFDGDGQGGGNPSYNPVDKNGHGTHVAGILGAADNEIGIRGVSPDVTLMAVKVLTDRNKQFTLGGIIDGVNYALDKEVDIINASFGGYVERLQTLEDAFQNEDVLVVTAAGNKGLSLDQRPFYPASLDLDNVISVASTDHSGNLYSGPDPSNYGQTSVHLAAPGTNIWSTTPPIANNGEDYGYLTGTSMAAPHVVGVAALMLAINPGLTPDQLKRLLITTVTPLPDLADKTVSGGQVNAFNALNILTNNTPPTLSAINNITITENSEEQSVAFTASDEDIAPHLIEDYLTVTAISDNEELIESNSISLTAQNDNWTLSFTPEANQSGEANITVTAFDGLATTEQIFTVTVDPIANNGSPVAEDDSFSIAIGESVIGNVLDNDGDPDSDPLTTSLINGPTNGALTLDFDGSFEYIPSTNFIGSDSFIYQVSDENGGIDTATVTLIVGNNFPAQLNLSELDGSNGFVISGLDARDFLGMSVSDAGDINADGIDDLIIGAGLADPNSNTDAGESYVVFGNSEVGNSGRLELSSLNGDNGFVINGIDAFDWSGRSPSALSGAGDINADGIDDLIIGAPQADPSGKNGAGESYVVFGSSSSISSLELSELNGSNGFVINGIRERDESGRSVAEAGDINADGIDDLIIGARSANSRAGQSYVLFGKEDVGNSGSLELSALNGRNGFAINGIDSFDESSWAISRAGDINADGIDDLIIGANFADPNGEETAGESYVVFGGKDVGITGSLELSSLNGLNGFMINGVDIGDQAGYSVSEAGDINADGIDDLIIGAFNADPNDKEDAGESYVVFGGSDVGSSGNLELSSLNGINGFVINGIDAIDRSGNSVSRAGDINADGIDDIIISGWLADPNGKELAGESYVIFGSDNIGSSGNFELSSLNGLNGFVINGIDIGDRIGVSVSAAGDVNADGIEDLIIGTHHADPSGKELAGESYVVFGFRSAR